MNKYILSTLSFFFSFYSLGQNSSGETGKANFLLEKADSLKDINEFEKAISFQKKAAEIYKSSEIWDKYFDCLFDQVENYKNLKDYSKAEKLSREILDESLAHYSKYKKIVAKSNFIIGELLVFDISDLKKGIHYLKQAIKVQEEFDNDQLVLSDYYNTLGVAYKNDASFELAIKYIGKGLSVRKKQLGENSIKVGDSYIDFGRLYSEEGNYELALDYFKRCISIYDELLDDNDPKMFTTLNNLGLIYWKKGEYSLALDYYKRAEKVVENNWGSNSIKMAMCSNNMGLVCIELGQYDYAISYFNTVTKIVKEKMGENHFRLGMCYNNIGLAYFYKDWLELALDHYQKALNIRLSAFGENHPKVADSYNNLGNVYFDKGLYKKSEEYHLKAMQIRKSVFGSDHNFIANSYENLGKIYNNQGSYSKAIEFYNYSLRIRVKTLGNKHRDVGSTYQSIGTVYQAIGDLGKAHEFYRKSYEIYKISLGASHPDIANVLNSIGNIFKKKWVETGDGKYFDLALERYENAVKIRKNFLTKDDTYISGSYNNLGALFLSAKKYDQALNYLEKSLEIRKAKFKDNHPLIAQSYNNLGVLFYSLNNNEKALRCFQKSIIHNIPDFNNENILKNPSGKHFYNPAFLLESLRYKAELLAKSNKDSDKALALQTFTICEKLIETVNKIYQKESDKVEFGRTANIIFNTAVEICIDLYEQSKNTDYLKKAFYYAERDKARVLYGGLANISAKKYSGIPDSLLQKERNINASIAMFRQKMINKPDSLKAQYFQYKIFSLNREHEKLIQYFETSYPKYFQLKYDNKQPTLSEIQAELNENSVFMEYHFGKKYLYAFTITKKTFNYHKLNIPKELDKKIESIPSALRNENNKLYGNNAYFLFLTLFKPLRSENTNYIIVPDGSLWQLNFDLLISKHPEYYDFRKMNYLIKEHEFSYAYSAKLFLETRRRKSEKPSKECLAFSYNSKNQGQGSYIAMRGENDNKMVDLPGTRKEIKAVSSVLKGTYFFGNYASESNFKQKAKDYSILHLALHGKIDSKNPMNSKLYFTQNSDSLEDNYLHAYELYNLELNADLAVLSACNTGLGKYAKGEGILSLGRAFTYAGCKSLLISKWEVSDAFTPDLMKEFYLNLKDGESKASSLRKAKLKYLSQSDFSTSNPYYWASLVQIGDNKPLRQNNYIVWVISTIAILTLIFIIAKKLIIISPSNLYKP